MRANIAILYAFAGNPLSSWLVLRSQPEGIAAIGQESNHVESITQARRRQLVDDDDAEPISDVAFTGSLSVSQPDLLHRQVEAGLSFHGHGAGFTRTRNQQAVTSFPSINRYEHCPIYDCKWKPSSPSAHSFEFIVSDEDGVLHLFGLGDAITQRLAHLKAEQYLSSDYDDLIRDNGNHVLDASTQREPHTLFSSQQLCDEQGAAYTIQPEGRFTSNMLPSPLPETEILRNQAKLLMLAQVSRALSSPPPFSPLLSSPLTSTVSSSMTSLSQAITTIAARSINCTATAQHTEGDKRARVPGRVSIRSSGGNTGNNNHNNHAGEESDGERDRKKTSVGSL
jgi:hypothetical protein